MLNKDSIIKAVEKRATDLVTHLSSRLEGKMYRDQDIKVIKNAHILISGYSLMLSVKSRGAATIYNLT